MKIIRDFRNELLKRKEINAVVENSTNPGFKKSQKDIAAHFGVDENLVVINSIKSKFGVREFLIDVFIYDSLDALKKLETKKKDKNAGRSSNGN